MSATRQTSRSHFSEESEVQEGLLTPRIKQEVDSSGRRDELVPIKANYRLFIDQRELWGAQFVVRDKVKLDNICPGGANCAHLCGLRMIDITEFKQPSSKRRHVHTVFACEPYGRSAQVFTAVYSAAPRP